jgi:hypothetical protein
VIEIVGVEVINAMLLRVRPMSTLGVVIERDRRPDPAHLRQHALAAAVEKRPSAIQSGHVGKRLINWSPVFSELEGGGRLSRVHTEPKSLQRVSSGEPEVS